MMATTNLSQKRATQRLLKYRLAVVTLARQAATKAVKRQLQAQAVKLPSLSAKDIKVLADDYLAQHCAELIAEAKRIIETSPFFASYRLGANVSSNAQSKIEPSSTTSAVQMGGAETTIGYARIRHRRPDTRCSTSRIA